MQKISIGKYIYVLTLFLFITHKGSAQKFSPSSYIAEHKVIAQQLSKETGVPASVILGIAIHESAYGNSRVATHLNNHFGIKGKNNSTKIRSAYKGYGSVKDSYMDFVGLLQRRKATNVLFDKLSNNDYKSWVLGVAKSGYSTTGDWSRKVLATINRYNLDLYDHNSQEEGMELARLEHKGEDVLLSSLENRSSVSNVVVDVSKSHTVKRGDTLSAIAQRNKMSVEELKRKNKLSSSKLSIGQRLLL